MNDGVQYHLRPPNLRPFTVDSLLEELKFYADHLN